MYSYTESTHILIIMMWLALLLTHAIHVMVMAEVTEETTCDKDTDGCDSLSDIDWEKIISLI